VEVNTVAEENNENDVCIQETEVQIDIEGSNIDVPNIHGSFKTNDGVNMETESSVDDDVEKNDVSHKIIQDLQNKTANNDVGMENTDETTNVCIETTINGSGKALSIQGDVELNNATLLEGNSVIDGYCRRWSDAYSR
jgi:hypothetical protein